ncbi:winged helix-turn-helix domain-containing protein [Dokdonella koreensis]|uniref:Transcriptional regulator domain protein n=1 Tax=Dokdonella koreensis DS-123 TaxID=1300342 RepID=A0A167G6C7_9GAMM|nr:winged helix-turn-helix domain-containing protein [Dokdonella koreensis]ANB16202.1 Transcriptional regulator domain protein [Dokdonella koreensis DS-123]
MTSPIFRFRNLRLDPATRQLWREGERVPLPLKSFDCLTYLIEHRDRAVGRDELIAAVWGRAEVSDKLLGQTLLRARRAIGDVGGGQTAIRTLPRFGYHWEEPVEIEIAPAEAAAPHTAEPPSAGTVPVDRADPASPVPAPALPTAAAEPTHRRWKSGPASLALAALLAAIAWWAWQRPSTPPAAAPAAATQGALVLILPVSGANPGEESWVRLGAMDYLASRLRNTPGLQVLPSEQTVALLGRDGTSDQRDESDLYRFEQMTGARYILAPRVSHLGSNWNAVLDVYHDRGIRSYEAQAKTPLEALSRVGVRFVEANGLPVASAADPPTSAAEYLQRIDAAVLAGDLAEAGSLAQAVPVEFRDEPAFVIRAARIAFRSGDSERAEKLLVSIDRADTRIPLEDRAQAAVGLGVAAIYRQDFTAAENFYSEAIALLETHGTPALLGKAYVERGVARGVFRRFDEAMSDFARGRVQLELAGDRLGGASLDTNLGLLEVLRNRYPEALAAYQRAVATYGRFGVNDNLVIALQGLAYVQRMLLDLDGAQASSERIAQLAEHLRNPTQSRRAALTRAKVMLDRGRLREAAELIQRNLLEADGKSRSPVFAVLQAQQLIAQGHPAQALADADPIIGEIERQGDGATEMYLSEAIGTYIDAALSDRQPAVAAHLLQRLRAAPQAPQDDGRPFVEALAQARIAAANESGDALARFAEAMTLADNRSPSDVVAAACAFADVLLAHGVSQEAPVVLGRLVPYVERNYDAARSAARLYAALGNKDLALAAQGHARQLAGERPFDPP